MQKEKSKRNNKERELVNSFIDKLKSLGHTILSVNSNNLPDVISTYDGKVWFFEMKLPNFDMDRTIGQCLRYFHSLSRDSTFITRENNGQYMSYTTTTVSPIETIALVVHEFPVKKKRLLKSIIKELNLPIYLLESTNIDYLERKRTLRTSIITNIKTAYRMSYREKYQLE